MEFRDLKTQYVKNKNEIDAAIGKVLNDTDFISGKQVEVLESRLAEYAGVNYCVTCANGTDALILALMVWGIGPGDAVFIPDFTFFATAEAVALLGATPIMVDIDQATFTISPFELEKRIKEVTAEGKLIPKAVIPVDLFGLPADYEKIRGIAMKYHVKILEDGAQGFGGRIGNQRACGFGDISTTSFFPAKPLGCYGDGGAVFTNDRNVEKLLRSLGTHGKGTHKYENIRIGLNSRLDTIQAAVLNVKLNLFEKYELESVNQAAKAYGKYLTDALRKPIVPPRYYSSWAQYTVLVQDKEERNAVQEMMRKNGIPSAIYYEKGLHSQKALEDYEGQNRHFPVTDYVSARCLSLPMHPYLSEDDIEKIAETVNEAVRDKSKN